MTLAIAPPGQDYIYFNEPTNNLLPGPPTFSSPHHLNIVLFSMNFIYFFKLYVLHNIPVNDKIIMLFCTSRQSLSIHLKCTIILPIQMTKVICKTNGRSILTSVVCQTRNRKVAACTAVGLAWYPTLHTPVLHFKISYILWVAVEIALYLCRTAS